MTKKVDTQQDRKASEHPKPKPHKVEVADNNSRAAQIAHKHGRPCESSAVFETWAQH